MLWSNFSFSQEFTNYTIKDGLPSNRVYRLTQDKEGFIWAITDKGMAKFNGKEFEIFNTRKGLPTNDIWDIRIDDENRAWYFSKSSKLGFIKKDSVYIFPTCEPNEIIYPASTNMYANNFVIGNANDWFYFDETCWQKLPSSRTEPFEIHRKTLLLSNNGYFKNKTNLRFRNQDSIMTILYNEGYSIVNLNNAEMYHKKFNQYANALNPHFVRSNFVNGQVQITGFDFVVVLGKDFMEEEAVKVPAALKSYFSMVDKSGNVWCATYSNGIYKLPQVKRQITYLLPNQKVDKMKRVGNKIIANVYNKGFYEYDSLKKKFTPFLYAKSFALNAVYIDSLQSAFFSSEKMNAQIRFEKGKKIKRPGIAIGHRNLIYHNGYLYAFNSAGVHKIDPQTLQEVETYNHYGVMDLIEYNGAILIAASDGIKILVGKNIANLDVRDKIVQNPVLDFQKISDSLLLVNTDGYGAYITDSKTAKQLPHSEFLSVESAFSQNGFIWLATGKGILKYRKAGNSYEYVETIDDNDGLPSKKVNSILMVGKDLLVSTDNGVAIFPKPQDTKTSQLLKIYIADAQFNQKKIREHNPSLLYTSNNTLNFTILTIDFSVKNTDPNYSYRLLPIQDEWAQTTSSNLNFSDLQPNDYTLEVKLNEHNEKYHFVIIPLWWQRPWTRALFALSAVLLLGFLLFQVRKQEIIRKTAKITAQKKMAEYELYALRSQMNPHFVFNSLAAIQFYINQNDFETSEKYLIKFSKLIRQFFELSKQEDISVNDEIALLKNYLDIEKLRFKEKLSYSIYLDNEINAETTKIPSMLLQPIVENAVNHGIFNKKEDGTITIEFVNKDEGLLIEITDDGVGFANTKKRINGAINSSNVLEDRINILNGSERWQISYSTTEAFPSRADKGNSSRFFIKRNP